MVKDEISTEILKDFKLNESENTTYQTLWSAAKAVLRMKHSFGCMYQKRISKINNVSYYLRKLEKEKQINSKVNRIKEIRIKSEINKMIHKINRDNNTASVFFFLNINIIDKPLMRLTMKIEREDTGYTVIKVYLHRSHRHS